MRTCRSVLLASCLLASASNALGQWVPVRPMQTPAVPAVPPAPMVPAPGVVTDSHGDAGIAPGRPFGAPIVPARPPQVTLVSPELRDARVSTPPADRQTPANAEAQTRARQAVSRSLKLELSGPGRVAPGRPTRMRIRLTNLANEPAGPLDVIANFPPHVRVVASLPLPAVEGTQLRWTVNDIAADAPRDILFDAVARTGDPWSVDVHALVKLEARMAANGADERATLTMQLDGPAEARVGETIAARLKLKNAGSEPIVNGGLRLFLSPGLRITERTEPAGPFSLSPGESLAVPIPLEASRPGLQGIRAMAEADGARPARAEHRLRVVQPALAVELAGPRGHEVGTPLDVVLSVENPGTAPSLGVFAFLELPAGMDVLSVDPAGTIEPENHLVVWRLGTLAPRRPARLRVTLRGMQAGPVTIRGSALNQDGADAESYLPIRLEGSAPLAPPMAARLR